MVNIDTLFREGKISRIPEIELERYVNFFKISYIDNIEHAKYIKDKFPRWTIISGYYAMHDSTKLLIAKIYGLKIDFEVHSTTIKVLHELLKDKNLTHLLEEGYNEFIYLANDLAEAKKERVKTQYYTGSSYSKDKFKEKAEEFLTTVVDVYLLKINEIIKRS